MKLKTLMSIKAVICLFFGVAYIVNPAIIASWYGMTLSVSGLFMARLFGQVFVLLALLLWLARNTSESTTQKAFGVSVLLGDLIGFVISLLAVLNGTINSLGWLVVALYLLLGLGFGLTLISKSKSK